MYELWDRARVQLIFILSSSLESTQWLADTPTVHSKSPLIHLSDSTKDITLLKQSHCIFSYHTISFTFICRIRLFLTRKRAFIITICLSVIFGILNIHALLMYRLDKGKKITFVKVCFCFWAKSMPITTFKKVSFQFVMAKYTRLLNPKISVIMCNVRPIRFCSNLSNHTHLVIYSRIAWYPRHFPQINAWQGLFKDASFWILLVGIGKHLPRVLQSQSRKALYHVLFDLFYYCYETNKIATSVMHVRVPALLFVVPTAFLYLLLLPLLLQYLTHYSRTDQLRLNSLFIWMDLWTNVWQSYQNTVNFLNSLNFCQTSQYRYYATYTAYPSQAHPSLSLRSVAVEYTCGF